jgi:hypothetical protein
MFSNVLWHYSRLKVAADDMMDLPPTCKRHDIPKPSLTSAGPHGAFRLHVLILQ